MNGEYIKVMDLSVLSERLTKYLESYERDFYREIFSLQTPEFNAKILRELQSRMKRFDEYIELTRSLYGNTPMRRDLLTNAKMKIETEADAIAALHFVFPYIEHGDYSSLDALK